MTTKIDSLFVNVERAHNRAFDSSLDTNVDAIAFLEREQIRLVRGLFRQGLSWEIFAAIDAGILPPWIVARAFA